MRDSAAKKRRSRQTVRARPLSIRIPPFRIPEGFTDSRDNAPCSGRPIRRRAKRFPAPAHKRPARGREPAGRIPPANAETARRSFDKQRAGTETSILNKEHS